MFITISGESAAFTYLETKPDKTFSPPCVCEHCAFTAFTADWLLPVVALRVTRTRNQSDGAVGGTMLEIPSQNATPSVHGELNALQTSFCDVFIANVHIAITIKIRLIVQAYNRYRYRYMRPCFTPKQISGNIIQYLEFLENMTTTSI